MSKTLQIKVCGVRDQSETIDALGVDYIGHIFWEHSSRYLDPAAAEAAGQIALEAKRIGVFVDATTDELMSKIEQYHLDGVQLHGNESATALAQLRQRFDGLIFKAFSIAEQFDFSRTEAYSEFVDLFVFDAAGRLRGGNGHTFNWKLLESYQGTRQFLLSGGIGPDQLSELKLFFASKASEKCIGLDLNSKFEHQPAHKDITKLANFITQIQSL
jgi:phosphoribosylanthranilate isomerase